MTQSPPMTDEAAESARLEQWQAQFAKLVIARSARANIPDRGERIVGWRLGSDAVGTLSEQLACIEAVENIWASLPDLLATIRRLREERDEALMIAEGPSTLRELAACSISNVHARHTAEMQRDEVMASWRKVAEHRAREAEQLETAESQLAEAREGLRARADWLASMHSIDLDEIVADNGITAGMVVQQEAREQERRVRSILSKDERL